MEPAVVEGIRQYLKGGATDKEVLIRWKNLPGYDAFWEPFLHIQQQFPDFNLEDNVALLGEGILIGPCEFIIE